MGAYYNEFDPYPAQWLRNLIAAGLIADGDVDERSIADVQPGDLLGYTQCHFFAGIGVWSHALRQAGWPDDRPVWTGSCPCQPFSAAGKRGGANDDRHLWPEFFRLIAERLPPVVFGEQVASKDGLAWLDLVSTDMEGAGYAFGAVDSCAAGVGAPHIRQRLYFVADATQQQQYGCGNTGARGWPESSDGSSNGVALGDANDAGLEGWRLSAERAGELLAGQAGVASTLVNPEGEQVGVPGRARLSRGTGGFWRDADWIYCRDEKYRAVEPGTFPLAHGAPARVGRLRAYGNAIVSPLAQEFIAAYLNA